MTSDASLLQVMLGLNAGVELGKGRGWPWPPFCFKKPRCFSINASDFSFSTQGLLKEYFLLPPFPKCTFRSPNNILSCLYSTEERVKKRIATSLTVGFDEFRRLNEKIFLDLWFIKENTVSSRSPTKASSCRVVSASLAA